jgi:DNA-binding NarL/FixJ family response regulator
MLETQTSSVVATTRVVLADDHDILRQGLRMLLSLQPEIEVVGEARTGQEAVAQVRALHPHVVVLDISMPDGDGFHACREICACAPGTSVLILTMHESEEYFLQALRAGAAGYLVKKAASSDLQMAIRSVAQGGAFLYPGLARALVRAYIESPAQAAPADNGNQRSRALSVLSPRELEVLKLVAEGHTNQEIATQLVISIKTVQAHRASVMAKLGLEHVTHLVRFAMCNGLLPSGFSG